MDSFKPAKTQKLATMICIYELQFETFTKAYSNYSCLVVKENKTGHSKDVGVVLLVINSMTIGG